MVQMINTIFHPGMANKSYIHFQYRNLNSMAAEYLDEFLSIGCEETRDGKNVCLWCNDAIHPITIAQLHMCATANHIDSSVRMNMESVF